MPIALIGYKSHLNELAKVNGLDLNIAVSEDSLFESFQINASFKLHVIDIAREINLLKDIISVFNFSYLLHRASPEILHSNTPKASIVSALAGIITRVPIRIHTFTGQRWTTLIGTKRYVLRFIDWLVIQLNTHVLADSPSQANFLNKEFKTNKVKCIGDGSFGGIDLDQFDHRKFNGSQIRQELNIDQGEFVILYLGRISKDKGIQELLEALTLLEKRNVRLLLVGPYEKELDGLEDKYEKKMGDHPAITRVGFTSEPQKYFAVCDLFCLPSYREGFGTVILEAAAMRKPTVGTRIYGITDAIVDGKTGLLCDVKSSVDLADKINSFIDDRDKLTRMGDFAYERVKEKFDYKVVTENLVDFYRKCLSEKGL